MKPLLHDAGGDGDLISFEIEGSRGADDTVIRLVGVDVGRKKEVSDIRNLRCGV